MAQYMHALAHLRASKLAYQLPALPSTSGAHPASPSCLTTSFTPRWPLRYITVVRGTLARFWFQYDMTAVCRETREWCTGS